MLRLLKDDVFSAWGQDQHRLALAEEPRARRASAMIFAAVALIYPAWYFIFMAVMPAALDSLGERLGMSAVMTAAIVCFRFRSLRRYMAAAEQVLLFVMTGHYLSLVWRNDLATPYMVGTFVVFASVSAVITRLAVMVAYSLLFVVAVAVMLALSGRSEVLYLEYLLGMGTVLTAVCVGTYRTAVVRQMAMTRISQGRQLLKQIIEAIPDPVFVRSADRRLVLANEAGRQFETATGCDLTVVARQEKETLAGCHTLEADAEVSSSFGPLAMSVKTAVAQLPDSPMMLVTIMRDVTERRLLEESLRIRLAELEQARERVRQLQGMLPICMHCSRIRADDGHWEKLEAYVAQNSSASFTHTLCSSCLEQHYPRESA